MDLFLLFSPRSIAIIGVSHDPKKVGHLVANNLLKQGYGGEVYFVNRDASKPILGKKVYPDLNNIKKSIDLAVLAVPADIALPYLDVLHEKGIKNVVLFAAGFKEIGEEGAGREEKLIEKCRAYGLNLLGPNCIGFVNTDKAVNTTFLKDISPKGNIGFISQSGALGSILNDFFAGHANVGFSHFVSLGNKSVVDECDVLEYLSYDPSTEVIGLYLEDVKNGKRFMEVLSSAASRKPVIILKSGTTAEGSQAALSHTGGLMGEDAVYTAAIRQCGAIRAETFREFTMLLVLASFKRLPLNKNVLVLSNAGGAGVLLTDQIIEERLNLVTISEQTKKKIAKAFGDTHKVTVRNPIDLLGDASSFDYKQGIELTMKEKHIGSVVVLLSPQANTEIMETAKVIVELQREFKEPIYPIFMGAKSIYEAVDYFEEHHMICFASFDDLPLALAKLTSRVETKHRQEAVVLEKLATLSAKKGKEGRPLKINLPEGKPFLSLSQALRVIKECGADVLPSVSARTEAELKSSAAKLGYPLVAKLDSDTVTHKTEVKGVVTNIHSLSELTAVFKHFKTFKDASCLLQPMVSGVELFVGAKRDPHFGPVAVVGVGGIFTEVIREVIYALKPLNVTQFEQILQEKKMGKLLTGFRGLPKVNTQELYNLVNTSLDLLDSQKSITDIDLNPVIATSKGLRVVDARILLKTP